MSSEMTDAGGYLVVHLERAAPAVEACLASLLAGGWRLRLDMDGLRVITHPRFHWPVAEVHRRHALIGEWRGETVHPSTLAAQARGGLALARRMIGEGWGSYLMVWLDEAGVLNVLRDPSGAIDAVWWRRGGATFLTDRLPIALDPLLPDDLAIDWERLGAILRTPALVTDTAPLVGLSTLAPGAWFRAGDAEVWERLWRPGDFARRKVVDSGPRSLAEVVDRAVVGVMRGRRKVIAELSGGLDSAIVVGTLAATGHAGQVSLVNYHGEEAEGDERRYAEAAARFGGFRLETVAKPVAPLHEEDFAPLGLGLRPALQGVDVAYDREAAHRLAAAGADGLVTGQGGDSVFFHAPDPRVAADRFRRIGLRALNPAYLAAVGRWTRCSAWTVARLAVVPGASGRSRCAHPWLADLDDLPPAKKGQVERLVNNQLFWTDCLRARQAPLLNPLLSQPVVEHCLGVPSDLLTLGARERGLARLAFADRLPPEIRERRSKGDLSAFYGQLVRASLPALRALLLDGRLVEHGVLDRRRLEADLDDSRLLWSEGTNQPLLAAVLEAWARHWQGRISYRRREVSGQPG
jgi:asparagine synthase (glutamine-hydrolysing)